ncbi:MULTISPECIES: hypothetical protein [Nostocales]|uniref:Uncharacterized protein n=3 Tax=Nostocales TaxID=1161 RepID=A0A8S9T2G7_9CYAN|nr:hypothetical protein [Tolypothrix bouteillei]KAF3885663.1 hypothetical protein DA73_0400009435 [Tolypothrix bouteillei VB521301]
MASSPQAAHDLIARSHYLDTPSYILERLSQFGAARYLAGHTKTPSHVLAKIE